MKLNTMKREKVLEALKELPKEFELDVLLEKLVFVEKVNKGLSQIKKGETLTHEKVKETVLKWKI
jgi:predicted transcriptional regulator